MFFGVLEVRHLQISDRINLFYMFVHVFVQIEQRETKKLMITGKKKRKKLESCNIKFFLFIETSDWGKVWIKKQKVIAQLDCLQEWNHSIDKETTVTQRVSWVPVYLPVCLTICPVQCINALCVWTKGL